MAEEITLKAYIERIETMIRQGRMDEAIAHSAHVLQFYPKNAEVYRNLGRALMRLQRYEEASEIFRRLLSTIPDDFSAHYQLSIVYEQEKNGDAALWHIERAFDQQPNSAQVNDRLRDLYKKFKDVDVDKIQLTAGAVAIQYNKSGMHDEAISLLQRTILKVPDRVDLITLLAITQWQRGDIVDAAETALDVLKSYPYALEANRILSELWLQEERPSDAQRYLSRVEDIDPYLAYEIATDNDVPDSQFMVEELDFSKYAASLASQEQAPDWLSNIEELAEAEQIALEDDPMANLPLDEVDEEEELEPAENLDWLTELSEDSQPVVPIKKVTDDLSDLLPDDFNVPDSAGQDDTVDTGELAKLNLTDDDENDAFAELFGDLDDSAIEGTGLTGLLGEDDDELPRPVGRTTGLTGMLSKLGLDDEDTDDKPETDDLSWLDDVSAGHYDTGNLDQIDSVLSDMDAANDFFTEMEEDDSDEDDALAWLDTDNLISNDRDDDDHMSTDDLIEQVEVDPNDPMAWLQSDGIEYDDNANDSLNFFVEDEPATIESDELSPMAWLGEDIETNEPGFDSNDFDTNAEDTIQEDPMAWLEDDGIEIEDTNDLGDEFGTDDLSADDDDDDDSMAWLAESGIEIDDNQESTQAPDTNEILTGQLMNLDEDSEDIEGDPMAWLQEGGVEFLDEPESDNDELDNNWLDDDSVLDDLLNIADLTATEASDPIDDYDLFSDTEMQDTMNDEPDWTPEDDLSSDEEFDWLVNDESGDEVNFEAQDDDSMAWLEDAGIEIEEDAEEPAFEAQDDDSMAWLEDAGIEIEEDTEEPAFEAQDDDSMAWLDDSGIEINDTPDEDLPQPTGKTSLLNFLSDDGDDIEINTNLDEITEEEAFAEEDVDWLRALDGEEIEDEEIASEGDTFADDFNETTDEEVEWNLDQTSDGDDFDWGDLEEIDDEQELDWMAEPSAEVEDFFPSSDDELAEDVVAEPADADWLSDLDADDNDLSDYDTDEVDDAIAEPADADWLEDVNDQQPVAEANDDDWLSELGDGFTNELSDEQTDEEWAVGDSFTDELDEDVVAEPADADWLSELDADDSDLSDYGTDDIDDDAVAEPADADWLEDVNDQQPVAEANDNDWLSELGDGFTNELSDEDTDEERAVGDSFTDELDEDVVAEPANADWLSDLDADDNDLSDYDTDDLDDDAVAEPANADWLEDVNDQQPVAQANDDDWLSELGDGFTNELSDEQTDEEWAVGDSFTDELDEDVVAEPADADWLSDLDADDSELSDYDTDDLDDDAVAEPADANWLEDVNDQQPVAEANDDDWLSELGDGFSSELTDEQTDEEWAVGDSFTDELDEDIVAEPADADWLSDLDADDSDLPDYDTDEDDDAIAEPDDADSLEGVNEVQPVADVWDDDEDEDITDELVDPEPMMEKEEDNWLAGIGVQEEDEWDEEYYDEYEDEYELNISSTSGMSDMLETIRTSREEGDDSHLDDFEHDEPEWLKQTGELISPVENDEVDWGNEEEAMPMAEFDEYDDEDFEALSEDNYGNDEYEEELEQVDADNAPDWLNAMVPGLDLDFEAEDEGHLDEGFETRENTLRERRINESETIKDDFDWLQDIVEEETGAIAVVSDEELSTTPPPTPIAPRKQYIFSSPPVWAQDDSAKENIAKTVSVAGEVPDYLSDFDEFEELEVNEYDFDETLDDEFKFESEEVVTIDDEFDEFENIEFANIDDEFDEFDDGEVLVTDDTFDEASDEFDDPTLSVEDFDFNNESTVKAKAIDDETVDQFGESAFESEDDDFVIHDEIDSAFDDFSDEFDNADNVIEDELDSAFDSFDSADNVIEDELDSAFDDFSDEFDSADNVIEDELDSAFDDFSDEFDNVDNVIEDELDSAFDDFSDEFDNVDNVIEDELDSAFDDFSDEFDNADNVIEDELDSAFDDFSDEFDNVDNVIEDELDSAFDSFDNADNVIEDELDSAFDSFDNADNVIEDELDSAFDDFDDEFDDFDDEFDD